MLFFLFSALLLASCSVGDDADGVSALSVLADAGGSHSCALSGKGVLWCWGANDSGQLGTGGTRDSLLPVKVEWASEKPGQMVATGYAHTCAVDIAGGLFCWGDNSLGQLGIPGEVHHFYPIKVRSGVVAVATGYAHTCAILEDKRLLCWGFNDAGQLGSGTVEVKMEGGRYPLMLALGFSHSCALLNDRSVLCWGDSLAELKDSEPVQSIMAGHSHTCAVLSGGTLQCWGDGTVEWSGVGRIQRAVGGKGFTCILNDRGEVYCQGDNHYGQLGRGNTAGSLGPVRVDLGGERRVVHLVAGSAHLCAIFADDSLSCWGYNGRGQLGDGKSVSAMGVAQHHEGIFESVVTGRIHSCALPGDGIPRCWGGNEFGQLGEGSFVDRHGPVRIKWEDERSFRAIVAGCDHTCGILEDDSLVCWGKNHFGQWGEGRFESSPDPVLVEGSVATVEAGCEHTCVVLNDGTRKCRGEVSLDWTEQSAHLCKIERGVSCMGSNERGQLGSFTPHRGDDPGEMGEELPIIRLD